MRERKLFPLFFFIILGIIILYSCNNDTATSSVPEEQEVIESEYIDIEKTNELKLYSVNHESVLFTVSDSFYNNFTAHFMTDDSIFTYADYYGLDESLALYKNSPSQKSLDSNLLNTNGSLCKEVLLHIIETNNQSMLSEGKNAANAFYTETSAADKSMICDEICDTINFLCSPYEKQQLSNTLSALTMFNRTGSPSNAYVTNHLTFVYNPTMSEMYADTQSITTDDDKDIIKNSVITHEIMHLIQHKNDDLNDENGIEVGICRTYNIDSANKKIPVDSLWNSWILEASAELGMADYLGIDPHTYSKKISYVNSYNLSVFDEITDKYALIEYIAFCDTLEEAYETLNLESVHEQREFLNFLFSVEILQMDPEDFWENHAAVTGESLTDEAKLEIRMSIRSEVIKYLSINFYSHLAHSLQEGEIHDFDTLFYLMRLWEIDCYGHLEYTKKNSLDSAKTFIAWHDEIQTLLFQELANSSELSAKDIETQYLNYLLQTQVDDIVSDNCSLNSFEAFTCEYLLNLKSNYNTANFVKNKDMMNYINMN